MYMMGDFVYSGRRLLETHRDRPKMLLITGVSINRIRVEKVHLVRNVSKTDACLQSQQLSCNIETENGILKLSQKQFIEFISLH